MNYLANEPIHLQVLSSCSRLVLVTLPVQCSSERSGLARNHLNYFVVFIANVFSFAIKLTLKITKKMQIK